MVGVFTPTETSKNYKSCPPNLENLFKGGTGEIEKNGGQQNHPGAISKPNPTHGYLLLRLNQ